MILGLDVATSISSLVTAIATLVGALGGTAVSISLIRTGRATHKIVNQQRTDMLAYNRALVRALRDQGIEVPIDQSLPEDEPE